MTASLRALLTNVIDYAGIFPPAKLPLDVALRQYMSYRADADRWMLGRFLCPAAQLAEIPEALLPADAPLSISAIGRGGATIAGFLESLNVDLADIAEFRRKFPGRVAVEAFEVKLPAAPAADGLAQAEALLQGAGLAAFFELALDPAWRETLPALLPLVRSGIKLRCGGIDAAAFPSSEQVALVLSLSVRHRLPFKATAGLHHPLRHFDNELQANAHGFVNVFVAGVLAATRDLTVEQLTTILDDEQPEHFRFTDDTLQYGAWSADREAIIQARRANMLSFGSCSFDEPRADLRALGWL